MLLRRVEKEGIKDGYMKKKVRGFGAFKIETSKNVCSFGQRSRKENESEKNDLL